jgi:hypothetical protein
MECLDNICRALHIQIDEWDVDRELADAIIQEISASVGDTLEKLWKLFDEYDNLFNIGEALNLEPGKYSLFTNLKEITEINNTYGNH